ncbi:hypothetical protein [Chitinivibrio alkaliphilus]|uniref:hypothetical protein n=1 Tax=Chitinivibrio alkaliphilus TaxID=1505232 RepID=UPI000558D2FF|nr:hypothetical protein [Chitinivibrio alkaliphilus]
MHHSLVFAFFQKYRKILPESMTVEFISWQDLPAVRAGVRQRFSRLTELWRSEAAVRLLYRELCDKTVEIEKNGNVLLPKDIFQRWKKRGMDPHKLTTYTATYSLSQWDRLIDDTPLFPEVVEAVNEAIQI